MVVHVTQLASLPLGGPNAKGMTSGIVSMAFFSPRVVTLAMVNVTARRGRSEHLEHRNPFKAERNQN